MLRLLLEVRPCEGVSSCPGNVHLRTHAYNVGLGHKPAYCLLDINESETQGASMEHHQHPAVMR